MFETFKNNPGITIGFVISLIILVVCILLFGGVFGENEENSALEIISLIGMTFSALGLIVFGFVLGVIDLTSLQEQEKQQAQQQQQQQ